MEKNKKTYTFFVANELDMNVINIFRATSQIRLQSTQDREKYTNGIKIYSLTIGKIVYLLENNINYKYFLNRVFENYSKIEFIGKNWCEDTWNNSVKGENIGKI
jgi:GCATC--recognizing type II restriction modification system (mmyCIII) endonuclease subunit